MSEFGYRCEHCDGMVRPKRVKREVFKHRARFVILEDVTIGVCDECGSRFYAAGATALSHLRRGTVAHRRDPRPAARHPAMTYPRVRLRAHLMLPRRDARTDARTQPSVVDLIGTAVERSRAVSDPVASSRQPVIARAAGTAQRLLGACVDPHHAFQSP
jgi:YgiT-type zinc finger domain-containing protein